MDAGSDDATPRSSDRPTYAHEMRVAVSIDGRAALTIAVMAMTVRLAWQLAISFYADPETWEMDAIARNILEGRGYVFEFM